MRKLFIVSTVVLFLLITSFLVYKFILKKDNTFSEIPSEKKSIKSEENKVKKENTDQSSVEKTLVQGEIKKIADNGVFFPVVDETKNKIKYYSKNEGGFWEISFDGSFKKKIVDEKFSNLNAIIWSPDKKNIILKINSDFYNYKYGETPKKIKDNISYLVWSNLGDKIIYIYRNINTNEKEINIADMNGGNWKKLVNIENDKNMLFAIPQTSLVVFGSKANSQIKTNFKAISIIGGSVDNIIKGKFGADYVWSPNGEKFIISSVIEKNGNNMALETGKTNKTEEFVNLNFPTLASKCVWTKNNKTIYCALASGIPEDAIMPNDYQSKKFYTVDSFWKIDTETGKKDRVVKMDDITEKIDATNLFLSPNEDILFFINRRNDSLYRITL